MSFTIRDAVDLSDLLMQVAEAKILPRFRNLSPEAVRQKTSKLDLVTDADEAAEQALEAGLARAFPGALVVGEEAVSRDPTRLKGLGDADLAFILDPVDGTLNFASGLPLFGVMAGVVSHGEVVCGVILDPIVGDAAIAVRDEGAWIQHPNGRTQPLRVAAPSPPSELTGSVSWRYLPKELRPVVTGNFPKFAATPDFRCAAHSYRLLAAGRLGFAFWSSVLPWDHAAGWLIHREAGGYTAHFDGSPYRPVTQCGGLINAPDQETWQVIRDSLLPPASSSF